MKILITGGHLSPALAVIEKLKKMPGTEIVYVGRTTSLEGSKEPSQEYLQITVQKIRFIAMTTGRLQRSFTRYTIPSLLKIPIGFFQAIMIVSRENPNCILSFGGYVAVPIVLAGWLRQVPIFTHEQTVTRGLANRIIENFAKKIFISWPESRVFYPKSKVILTGNPLREEIFMAYTNNIPGGLEEQKDFPLVYITGGSQGSESINDLVLPILSKLLNRYRVVHQFGKNKKSEDKIREKIATLSKKQKNRYFATPFIDVKTIGWVLENADLIIGRSGANTVSELLALGKNCLLIPLPWAGGEEQEKNAQVLVRAGLGKILYQKTLFPELLFREITLAMGKKKKFPPKMDEKKVMLENTATEKIISTILAEIKI